MNNFKKACNDIPVWRILVFLQSISLLLSQGQAQIRQDYHFVYIDISKSVELRKLQDRLEDLFNQVQKEKYVFFLSNRDEPYIATNQAEFNKMLVAISNLTSAVPFLDNEIRLIDKAMTNNEFLEYDASTPDHPKLKPKYLKTRWHFFLNPDTYNNLNMKKYLVDKLRTINYDQQPGIRIEIMIYFDALALEKSSKIDMQVFDNKEFVLIKY